MKNNKKRKNREAADMTEYGRLSLTKNFVYYIILFVGAVIFTQALRSHASNIFFSFVFFLPFVMLIYAHIARTTLHAIVLTESAEIEKQAPYTYKMKVINESFLPYPFIEAAMSLPQSNSVRCRERRVKLAMSPFSAYEINNTVRFRFRGTYEIGVNCLYVYDFFRMFRVRVDVEQYIRVYVLPRKMLLHEDGESAVSDSSRETKKDPHSYEKIEISDIREYRSGDSLKTIHWKLSSKSEDFLVRDYDTGSSKHTVIYCDLSARFPEEPPEKAEEKLDKKSKKAAKKAEKAAKTEDKKTADETVAEEIAEAAIETKKESALAAEKGRRRRRTARAARENRIEIEELAEKEEVIAPDVHALASDEYYEDMNEYCADGVVELTVAAVIRELEKNNECSLIWFDSRSESGVSLYRLRGMEDLNAVYTFFATAPLCGKEQKVTRLSAMLTDTQDIKQIYVTSAIDEEAVGDFGTLSTDGGTEILLYDPENRFAHPSDRELYIEGCRAQLATKGMKLIRGRLGEGAVL